ncbi:MAG: hypothetical protein H7308_08865 [Chthonomonadaceae bacterium]|nr:hypothetical protein [Chthonomonadaceae bacterium]
MANISEEQKKHIDRKIKEGNLNEFGDSKDTVYAGGTPLFNMMTGQTKDRYEYVLGKHPDWKI